MPVSEDGKENINVSGVSGGLHSKDLGYLTKTGKKTINIYKTQSNLAKALQTRNIFY